jgi:hypothetical protein
MPVLSFLRDGQCNGMHGDREIVITLFTAEGGMLDGSVCTLFADWRFGFFAYAVEIRQAVGYQRPAAAVELVIVSIPMFVLYVRFRRLAQAMEQEIKLLRSAISLGARQIRMRNIGQLLIDKEALIQKASALPSESEGRQFANILAWLFIVIIGNSCRVGAVSQRSSCHLRTPTNEYYTRSSGPAAGRTSCKAERLARTGLAV